MPAKSGRLLTTLRAWVVPELLVVACGHTASDHEPLIRDHSADNGCVGV
jgi:hypothetical protein